LIRVRPGRRRDTGVLFVAVIAVLPCVAIIAASVDLVRALVRFLAVP
jgi:hypothetical protein